MDTKSNSKKRRKAKQFIKMLEARSKEARENPDMLIPISSTFYEIPEGELG